MFINEANKEDLRRRNRELRHKMIIKAQQIAAKKAEKDKKNAEELEKNKLKALSQLPDLILTMSKRLRRISPWSNILNYTCYEVAFICFYKLRQMGVKQLKIGANSLHSWVEFNYDNKWWVFDLIAIKKTNLKEPIKNKGIATQIEYTTLTSYFDDVDEFLNFYGESISISKDEAKIIAMEDDSLNSIRINYH